MDIHQITEYKSAFDTIERQISDDNGENIEVWFARELQHIPETLRRRKWLSHRAI